MDYDEALELVKEEFEPKAGLTTAAMRLAMLFRGYCDDAVEDGQEKSNLYDFGLYIVAIAYPNGVKTVDDLFRKENKV